MSYLEDRSARLFYDRACGPCRFLAQAAEGTSRHRLVASPLDSSVADEVLGSLPAETRYGYAHVAKDGAIASGEGVVAPLVGLTLGPAWERVVRRVALLDRALTRTYRVLWEYRRAHGCGGLGRRTGSLGRS